MLHIRYLNTARPLCEFPEALEEFDSFVVADYNSKGGTSCWECSAILMAHNKKSMDKELLEAQNTRRRIMEKKTYFESEGAAFYAGVLLATFVWAFLVSFAWAFGWIR